MSSPNAAATVTSKGQITLRRRVLDHIGVRPGERVEVVLLPDGRAELRPERGPGLESLRGILKRPGQRVVSIEDMNEATERGWAGLVDMGD